MIFNSNYKQDYRVCAGVSLIDHEVHLAWNIGICANQTLGNLPGGLKFTRTHSQTQNSIYSRHVDKAS